MSWWFPEVSLLWEALMFHLAWFLGNGFGIQPWDRPSGVWNGTNGLDWMKPDIYIDMATQLERAGFDYILIEDTTSIDDTYGSSMETTVARGFMAPKNDPLPLVPLMTRATRRIGVVPTISTSFWPPYMAARMMTTLDHLTEGRVGINIVTSVNHRAAQNFGLDRHLEHDLRYDMAAEWLDVVGQLWESWDPDAIVLDEERSVYADHQKIHPIDFSGTYYKVRGPLNTIPGPQRRPVVAQAGSSPQGRQLAAGHADTILALANTVEEMKAYRADVHTKMEALGRKPDECKVLFLVRPVVAESDEAARERQAAQGRAGWEARQLEQKLWYMSYQSGGEIDFAALDLDEPMPEVLGNGEKSVMASFLRVAGGKTLREVAATHVLGDGLDLVGSPDTVAGKMGEIMEEIGGDGFIVTPEVTRQAISEIADGLAPALRRRKLIRGGYSYEHFRDNLLEF
jgi:long-chain alkane monooxygenase